MEKRIIKTQNAPAPAGPYSQGVRVGNLFFFSGQGPIDPKTGKRVSGGVSEQTRQVLENIKNILKAAGLGLENVVKARLLLNWLKMVFILLLGFGGNFGVYILSDFSCSIRPSQIYRDVSVFEMLG